MERKNTTLLWGSLLVIGGLALLLQNLGVVDLGSIWAGFWALLFGVGGLVFIVLFLQNQQHWWALIPGFTLLGLGTLVGMQMIAPGLADLVGAPMFLTSIGLGFWAVYLVRREQWWAIIPGGVLVSVALFVLAEEMLPPGEYVGLLFMGLSATFALVAILPNPSAKMTWAFIPAGILFAIGLLFSTPFFPFISIIGPLALIAGGIYVVYRMLGKRDSTHE